LQDVDQLVAEMPQRTEFATRMSVRGIVPFHDFEEGPDWWTSNDYKFILEQCSRMKMNFIGLHTYNQIEDPLNELAGNHWGNWTEPTVWTGFPEDVNPDGTVRSSSAASWSTTFGRTGQNWNGRSANTSSFANGAWQIFEDECYDGSHVHDGFCTQLASCETGNTTCISMNQSNQLFNRVGAMFADWIQYSRNHLGMKVSLGTETPMTYPPQYGLPSQFSRKDPFNATITQRLYEGLFLRLQRSGQTPDYFNIWCVLARTTLANARSWPAGAASTISHIL
jgi:hypothetical protein